MPAAKTKTPLSALIDLLYEAASCFPPNGATVGWMDTTDPQGRLPDVNPHPSASLSANRAWAIDLPSDAHHSVVRDPILRRVRLSAMCFLDAHPRFVSWTLLSACEPLAGVVVIFDLDDGAFFLWPALVTGSDVVQREALFQKALVCREEWIEASPEVFAAAIERVAKAFEVDLVFRSPLPFGETWAYLDAVRAKCGLPEGSWLAVESRSGFRLSRVKAQDAGRVLAGLFFDLCGVFDLGGAEAIDVESRGEVIRLQKEKAAIPGFVAGKLSHLLICL